MQKSDAGRREPGTFLITQALPYANGDIHLGHLVEAVQTDVYVRYRKLVGDKAVFVCADDTHGTPIELTALRRGITPEQLIAEARENHVKDYARFSIDFDIFYSTNSEENRGYAEYIYRRLRENDLIVEREISQYYCEHDGRFLPDRFVTGGCPKCGAADQYGDVCEACGSTYEPTQLIKPRCVICGNTPAPKKSTHLFVRLDKCEGFLREYVNRPGLLKDDMRNFVSHWIEEGLREWCISRDGPYFGFRIPDTENKYFYVWLDAPIGYIASTDKWCQEHGEQAETFWGKDSPAGIVHFIGKDIVYFHALFWPVMLDNAGFNLPRRMFVHGFLTIEGEKMSKTRGTFVLAREFADKVSHRHAPEYLRFFFAAKLAGQAGDIDMGVEEFCNRVNTTLVNNIGNLHHRTFVFCRRYFDSRIPDGAWDEETAARVKRLGEEIEAHFEHAEYKAVIEKVHLLGNLGNKYYQDTAPWKAIKEDRDQAASVMVTCVNIVKALAVFLKPVVPGIVGEIERQLGMTLSWKDYEFSLRNAPLASVDKLVKPIGKEELKTLFHDAGAGKKPDGAGVEGEDNLVDIAQFQALDLRIGTIAEAEALPRSKKLLKLGVDSGGKRLQVVAGIAAHYVPETLVGTQVVLVANLKPATLMGERSEGMLLAARDGESLVLIRPEAHVSSGARVS